MPILFNFHILLATFYTIFGTNILIQCTVPIPVHCMFYVSQKTNIKQSPNGIKMDGELFWNIWDLPEEESARNGARGARGGWRSSFAARKLIFGNISGQRFQSNRSYGSLDIKETVKGQNQRTQKQRDRSNLGGALAPPKPWEPRTRG